MTSLGENKINPSPILHSVKLSDVTRWKQGYIRPPPPILFCISQLGENKEGQGHWVSQNMVSNQTNKCNIRYIWFQIQQISVIEVVIAYSVARHNFKYLDNLIRRLSASRPHWVYDSCLLGTQSLCLTYYSYISFGKTVCFLQTASFFYQLVFQPDMLPWLPHSMCHMI